MNETQLIQCKMLIIFWHFIKTKNNLEKLIETKRQFLKVNFAFENGTVDPKMCQYF